MIQVINTLVFQIPCEDRCLDPQTAPEKTFRGSKHLFTRYLDDFGRLGIHACLLNWRFWKLISRSYMFSSSCWMMISGQVKSLESWNEVITKKIRTLISSFGNMWTSLSILTPQKCLFWEPGPLLYRFQPLHWRVQGSLGMLESHHVSLVFFEVKLFERIWKGLWVSFFLGLWWQVGEIALNFKQTKPYLVNSWFFAEEWWEWWDSILNILKILNIIYYINMNS